MNNIPPNKEQFYSKNDIPYDVSNGKDVFDSKIIKTWDVINSNRHDAKINGLPDIFPSSKQNDDDLFA